MLKQFTRRVSRFDDEIHQLSALYWSNQWHWTTLLHVIANKKNTHVSKDIHMNVFGFYLFFSFLLEGQKEINVLWIRLVTYNCKPTNEEAEQQHSSEWIYESCEFTFEISMPLSFPNLACAYKCLHALNDGSHEILINIGSVLSIKSNSRFHFILLQKLNGNVETYVPASAITDRYIYILWSSNIVIADSNIYSI